jgi:UDP-3-O-[3-hydroxymyristoyl] glucosamine N-acyltransferase
VKLFAFCENLLSMISRRLIKPKKKRPTLGGRKKEIYSKIVSSVVKDRFSEPGISEYAIVADSAKIAESATIAAGAYIGANVRVGENTRIYPNATILDDTVIGRNVVVGSGSVLGAEGYGFYYKKNQDSIEHVPQIRKVIIQDNVFIGANSSIHRGSKRDTVIGKGSKVNSNVHIAHNVVVGKNCLIMASVSIHGSTDIGDNVVINPTAAISKNVKIGDNAEVGMNATVIRDVLPNTRVLGTPAKEK